MAHREIELQGRRAPTGRAARSWQRAIERLAEALRGCSEEEAASLRERWIQADEPTRREVEQELGHRSAELLVRALREHGTANALERAAALGQVVAQVKAVLVLCQDVNESEWVPNLSHGDFLRLLGQLRMEVAGARQILNGAESDDGAGQPSVPDLDELVAAAQAAGRWWHLRVVRLSRTAGENSRASFCRRRLPTRSCTPGGAPLSGAATPHGPPARQVAAAEGLFPWR